MSGRPAPAYSALAIELPHALHRATPAELKARLAAERRERPLLLYRDGDGAQQIHDLGSVERLTIGRSATNGLPLPWDSEVSRVHASIERLGDEWTLVDDGRSRNGTFVDGERVSGRVRLRDGDAVGLGRTVVVFRSPTGRESLRTATSQRRPVPAITEAQRRVLVALCRPYAGGSFAAPASNKQIADELVLGVETIKTHMRALFDAFDLGDLPSTTSAPRSRSARWTAASSPRATSRAESGSAPAPIACRPPCVTHRTQRSLRLGAPRADHSGKQADQGVIMATTTAPDPVLDAREKALCRAINAFRAEHGRPPLKVSVALVRAAEWMSRDMARNDSFDHVDSRGRGVSARLRAFGYDKPTTAENIAAGESSAAATMAQWKRSPAHRANMLRTKHKVVGVGRAHDPSSAFGWYWTADFGGTVTRTMRI